MERKMGNDYNWIVVKYDVEPNKLVCERCGKTKDLPPSPFRSSEFLAIGKEFEDIHKNCKEK
jgi:hypothetical protein